MQTDTIEAGGARSGASARRRADHRDDIDTLKARMRGAIASLGLPRHVAQAGIALVDIWQRGKGLFPEQATIAIRASYRERRIRDALKELRVTYGLITWEQRRYRGVQTSNLYTWTPQFWALVNAPKGGPTGGKECRPQGAKIAARRRQPLPTNGDLPFSERSSLNGIQPCTEPPVMPDALAVAPASPASPSPSFSEHQTEGAAADLSPSHALPAFVSNDDDPAFVELVTVHAAAHAAKYRRAIEASGERYSVRDAGTIRAELRPTIAAELRNLAARAHVIALAKLRDDLTTDAIRADLTRRIVDAYMAQERDWLLKKKHCLGGLWNDTDGKPCDLRILGERALETWGAALDPAEPPHLDDLLEQAAQHLEQSDDAEAREACAELRARLAASTNAHELLERPVELDQEHDDTDGDDEAPAELPPPLPRAAVPPSGQRVTAELRAELERIDAEDRERAEQRRARRTRTRRRDRAHLATRPRERLALLAALMTLAAPSAPLTDHEHEPTLERPAAATWTGAAPPLLRDARERPARRAPRRRRAPRGQP